MEKSKYGYHIAELNLNTFIGREDTEMLTLRVPIDVPFFDIDVTQVIKYLKANNTQFTSSARKHLEAERDLQISKASSKQINILANFGLNNASDKLSTVYNNIQKQISFSLGISTNLVDWGRSKYSYKSNLALIKLAEKTNQLEEASLVKEVTTLTENIKLLRKNIELSRYSDSLAERRYVISNELYKRGKVSITELQISQSEKDASKRGYYSALRDYWQAYYLLRKLTVHDFEKFR